MNIGIVTAWLERGAGYVSRAYRDVLADSHNVQIYARGPEAYPIGDPAWDHDNVTWGRRVHGRPTTYVDPADFREWVKKHRIELVIFNEQHSWDIVLEARKFGLLIGSYVDYYLPETVPFFDLYDFLLCNTRRHHSVFASHPQALYVPWGTDTKMFAPDASLSRRPSDGVTFFHSAGASPRRKGTDLLVRAFRHVTGKTRLIIHSQRTLVQVADIREIIMSDPRIEVIHEEVGAPGLYHLGDVYVYPTRLEGIGLTVPEALACGLPVITTDAPPMNEFVRPPVNGRLVPVEREQRREDGYFWPESICSEKGLTAAMQAYVDDAGHLDKLRRQARTDAVENLDFQKNARHLADKLQALMPQIPGQEVVKQAAQYERAKYGLLWMPLPAVLILRRLGLVRLKRRLFSRKMVREKR